ncbi:MAG: hypothetical protein AAFX03_12365 [Pseudomonadota bacterium]
MLLRVKHIAALFLMAAPAAHAAGPEALEAFAEGRFQDAAEHADAADDADHHAFAARAILAGCMTGDTEPRHEHLKAAEARARAALALDPDHIEGRLQLAISLSLQARPLSTSEARKSGHGDVAKELAESVVEDDADNPYAHAVLAIWNIEVLRRGGRLGGVVMGASLKQARRHYEIAAAATPDDASLHWQYARALAAHKPKKNREAINAALRASINASVDDELERIMQSRAIVLAEALQTMKPKSVASLAEGML